METILSESIYKRIVMLNSIPYEGYDDTLGTLFGMLVFETPLSVMTSLPTGVPHVPDIAESLTFCISGETWMWNEKKALRDFLQVRSDIVWNCRQRCLIDKIKGISVYFYSKNSSEWECDVDVYFFPREIDTFVNL